MTEQERREYAIDIYNAGIALDATDFAFGVDGDSHFDRLAEHLAQLGYRKEEEVRNEKAREIINYIKGLIVEPFFSVEICEQDLRHIAKKFGVEVEE